MTKQEEKQVFAQFIAGLPTGSYLKDILREIQLEVESAITNDLGFIDFRGRIEEQRAHVREIAELQNRLNEIKADCRKLDNERARLAAGLDQLRSEARSLAKLALS